LFSPRCNLRLDLKARRIQNSIYCFWNPLISNSDNEGGRVTRPFGFALTEPYVRLPSTMVYSSALGSSGLRSALNAPQKTRRGAPLQPEQPRADTRHLWSDRGPNQSIKVGQSKLTNPWGTPHTGTAGSPKPTSSLIMLRPRKPWSRIAWPLKDLSDCRGGGKIAGEYPEGC
jgi:hypothetical protein